MENAEVKFTVTPDDLDWITRAASVLGSPNSAFFSDGESVSIETFDAKDDSAHVNSTKLNVNGTGAKYRMVFATDNLKLIPGSYDITISSKGILCGRG
jgi:hypothetical protein